MIASTELFLNSKDPEQETTEWIKNLPWRITQAVVSPDEVTLNRGEMVRIAGEGVPAKVDRAGGRVFGQGIVSCGVMDNHFHLLSEVPPVRVVPDEQIVRSFAALYPETIPWQPLSA